VLVITGARQAGVPGTGTHISNGGTLKLGKSQMLNFVKP